MERRQQQQPSTNARVAAAAPPRPGVLLRLRGSPPAPPPFELSSGSHSQRGAHHPNEDRVAVQPCAAAGAGGLLALVVDGHDGSRCADHVIAALPRLLTGATPAALQGAFAGVELEWMGWVRRALARPAAATGGLTSGACVTAAVVGGDGSVAVANVGDARAVLRARDGRLTVLTEDHRCCNEGERRRILAAPGGFIRNNRVVGVLEPTRTIGDLTEKARAPGAVSSEPSVARAALAPGDVSSRAEVAAAAAAVGLGKWGGASSSSSSSSAAAATAAPRALPPPPGGAPTLAEAAAVAPSIPASFLLVATDGVWDVLSASSATAVVAHALARFGDARAAAAVLCRTAARCGSADDISAAVVWVTTPPERGGGGGLKP